MSLFIDKSSAKPHDPVRQNVHVYTPLTLSGLSSVCRHNWVELVNVIVCDPRKIQPEILITRFSNTPPAIYSKEMCLIRIVQLVKDCLLLLSSYD